MLNKHLSKLGFLIALTGTILMPAAKANAKTLIDWDTVPGWTAPTSGTTKSFTSDGGTTEINFLLGNEITFVNFGGSGQTPAISNVLNGSDPDTNKSLHLQIDPQKVGLVAGNNSATLTTKFKNFGGLLEGVTFKLFDIDIATNSWQDRVILKGFAGNTVIDPIFSIFDPTTVKKTNAYTLDGIKSANNNVNNGNVQVSFASAIDGFELVFTDGPNNGTTLNPGSHGIGIGDLTYTKVPEPTAILGLLAVGAFGISSSVKRKSQNT